MQFCPLPARKCTDERFCKGGLHAPQSDLDSLSSPNVCLAHSHSCRAGNLFNPHTLSRWWCCPNAHTRARPHTHTEEHIRCMLYGPHRSKSSLIPLFQVKWSGISTLSPSFFLFFYRSGFYCSSVQNIRGCPMQTWKKRKLCTVMLVVCVTRRVFGVPAWNHNLLSRVTMRKETVQ